MAVFAQPIALSLITVG